MKPGLFLCLCNCLVHYGCCFALAVFVGVSVHVQCGADLSVTQDFGDACYICPACDCDAGETMPEFVRMDFNAVFLAKLLEVSVRAVRVHGFICSLLSKYKFGKGDLLEVKRLALFGKAARSPGRCAPLLFLVCLQELCNGVGKVDFSFLAGFRGVNVDSFFFGIADSAVFFALAILS